MIITPLENWIRSKVLQRSGGVLTRDHLEAYQLEKLRDVVALARIKSPFYRELLAGSGERAVEDLMVYKP